MFVRLSVVLPNVVAPDNCSLFSRCISVEEKSYFLRLTRENCIVEVSALTTMLPPLTFINALKNYQHFRDVNFEFYPSLTFLGKTMCFSDISPNFCSHLFIISFGFEYLISLFNLVLIR